MLNTLKSQGSKGQWFIISAVMISIAFITIGFILRGYTQIDTSEIQTNSIYPKFENFTEKYKELCINSIETRDKYTNFSKDKLFEEGIVLIVKDNGNCETDGLILMSSNKVKLWEGARPEITNIDITSDNIHIDMTNVGYEYGLGIDYYNNEGSIIDNEVECACTKNNQMCHWRCDRPENSSFALIKSNVLIGNREIFLTS